MISRVLSVASLVMLASLSTLAQEIGRRPVIVPVADGAFVAFKSETNWTDLKKASTGLHSAPAIVESRAVTDDNQTIHRVLQDETGRFVFGYDLWISPNPSLKQFKIAIKPLDSEFERQLKLAETADDPVGPAPISTFPKSTEPQVLDDGDAFSLDLLVNQGIGIKIVDIVKVTFDREKLKELNPRNAPRDFTLDAVELSVRNYRLLVNGNVAGVGKSATGCAGNLLWFYVQGKGRFIVSLVPREGYDFHKVGVLEGNRIEFTLNDNRYEWLSSSPILPGGGSWNLWVLHDPKYEPIFGSDPALPRQKNILEKLDDAVSRAEQATGLRARNPSTPRNDRDVQKSTVVRRPLVMVGGGDRIENLWPRNQ
jgi:hypothetical protein